VLTTFLIVMVTACMVASQLLLKRAVGELGVPSTLGQLVPFFFGAMRSSWMGLAVLLQLTGFGLWLIVLARERLGVAVAVSGSAFYVLTAVLAWVLYDEQLTLWQWVGMGFITVGIVMMLASTS
jgi:drug/metabolite transporter (DMT)-like permease